MEVEGEEEMLSLAVDCLQLTRDAIAARAAMLTPKTPAVREFNRLHDKEIVDLIDDELSES
jgi:hypothetical protein